MPRQITAYEADDGTVHATEVAAAKHDAKKALGKLEIFNEGSLNAVIENRAEIVAALQPLLDAEEAL